ncbi:FAD-dependent oxidoreductase [Gorillibacterium sp. CAU 1737]|uniref:protoporphyrinogen/coproporphyrinogen oxidase n=1 Tax=Gorillibacterium sp. CAU 1737 TaxID=3140362 RepID=UPI0032617077
MKVAVIGGGLAGLTAAAYLSESNRVEGVLYERSPHLGGRAFTYEKNGFILNYGAHAIYGMDRHDLSDIAQELGLTFESREVDKRKVMYAKGGRLISAPLNFVNLLKTDLLTATQKVRFVGEITSIIAQLHKMKNYPTLGDFLRESKADEEIKELWVHLVCSNFFLSPEDACQVPGPVISDYYHNLFLSRRPVNYILGSWSVITEQLKDKIERSGRFQIRLKDPIESISLDGDRFLLRSKTNETAYDRVILAMPLQQALRLLATTPWGPPLASYEGNTPTEVLIYDLGLREVVARPFAYISDMDHKLFISDVSATDPSLVPQGGQLLQGVAYLTDRHGREEEYDRYLEDRQEKMESLFDRYYPGWREAVVVKRVSKKAMVTSVKNVLGNELLPITLPDVPFYFCGDGCAGKGELAERAFSSARAAARLVLEEAQTPLPVR